MIDVCVIDVCMIDVCVIVVCVIDVWVVGTRMFEGLISLPFKHLWFL
jgi:hypothetical protein